MENQLCSLSSVKGILSLIEKIEWENITEMVCPLGWCDFLSLANNWGMFKQS